MIRGAFLAVALMAIASTTFAQCGGGSCSSGSCGNSAVTNNSAVIQQQEDQIRQLQDRINQLSAVLQNIERNRAIVRDEVDLSSPVVDKSIVQIGKSTSMRIQPIQLNSAPIQTVQQTTTRPSLQSVPQPTVQVQARPVQQRSGGRRWNR